MSEVVEKVKAGLTKHDDTSSEDLRKTALIGYKYKILDEE
jgi:hypothetical protein